MAEEKMLVVKTIGTFNTMNLKKDGSFVVTFDFSADQKKNIIKTTLFTDVDINLAVKVGKEKAMNLGFFRLDNFTMKKEGNVTLKLKSSKEYADIEEINNLALLEEQLLKIKMSVDLTTDEEEGD